jgi:hypothetical protein
LKSESNYTRASSLYTQPHFILRERERESAIEIEGERARERARERASQRERERERERARERARAQIMNTAIWRMSMERVGRERARESVV